MPDVGVLTLNPGLFAGDLLAAKLGDPGVLGVPALALRNCRACCACSEVGCIDLAFIALAVVANLGPSGKVGAWLCDVPLLCLEIDEVLLIPPCDPKLFAEERPLSSEVLELP